MPESIPSGFHNIGPMLSLFQDANKQLVHVLCGAFGETVSLTVVYKTEIATITFTREQTIQLASLFECWRNAHPVKTKKQ